MKTSPRDLDTAALIIQLVCRHFGCTCEDLESRSREMNCVWPRWLAIYLIHRYTKLHYTVIGELFDRRRIQVYNIITKALPGEIMTNRARAAELAEIESLVGRVPPPGVPSVTSVTSC